MNTKLITSTAIAALAFPAAAAADKPEKPTKTHKPAKQKSVGFTVAGVDLSGLNVTDGKLGGALTLDPTSANKHARTFLDLTKTELRGQDTVSLGTADDAVLVKYVGLTSTDAIQPTDRVKVIGKLSGGELNIRKITVTRGETEDAQKSTESKSSTSSKRSPGQTCRTESRKKAEGETKSAHAQCVNREAKSQGEQS